MSESWDQVQYPSSPFGPPSPPSTWFNPLWMSAIDQSQHQSPAMPVYPIDYYYWIPSFFFQGEPSNQRNPVYYEAWQNPSTWLMPEYGSEALWGEPHNYPAFFQQLSTPTFLPDGTGVTSPTSTKPSPGIGSGRSKTERV